MTFQIKALDPAPFERLFSMDEDELRANKAIRMTADGAPGFPCRVSLEDAKIGETVVLVNYEHLEVASPYASKHAVYVRKGAEQGAPAPGETPPMLTSRFLSVRGFDAGDEIIDATLTEGGELAATLEALFTKPSIAYAHIHFAARGCFAARAERTP
ncbi:MAG: DUF1203 domain-containing protein [Pseudomonadota bacterium]